MLGAGLLIIFVPNIPEMLDWAFGGISGKSSSGNSQKSRNCVKCGRQIPWDAKLCPYCGHDFSA